jgi:hypothetical protein
MNTDLHEAVLEFLTGNGESLEYALKYNIPEYQLTEAILKLVQRGRCLYNLPSTNNNEYDRRKVLFVHIDKTGGTTLNSVIGEFFHIDKIFYGDQTEFLKQALKNDMHQYDYISGHYYLGWLLDNTAINTSNTKVITFLREPIQRCISHYGHWMRQLSEDNFVSPLLNSSNLQTLRLSKLSQRKGYASVQNHLESAKESITDCYFVGLQENFEEDAVNLLNLLRGFKIHPHIPKLNTAKKIHNIPDEVISEIEDRNLADIELYNWTVNNRSNPSFEFDTFNNTFGEPQRQFSIDWSTAIVGEGWYYRELSWRWMSNRSTIYCHMFPNVVYLVTIEICNALTIEILDSLKIYANDNELILEVISSVGLARTLQAVIPYSCIQSDKAPNLILSFAVIKAVQFNKVDRLSNDDRSCSIALSSLSIVQTSF